jgi:eukaryotic-like serine/threonine-protein kinase
MGAQNNSPLPDGLELGGYHIVRRIATGGFSIVYLAEDQYGHRFAVKEYLPSTLVKRGPGQLVPTIGEDNLLTYQNGLKCFFEEGRALARIFHPNVVRVVNFFRGNETVYMVMAFEEGRTLQEVVLRARNKQNPNKEILAEPLLRRIFSQVMNGLREVHAARLLHLDIKPANVYLRTDGSPMLLDFGAARQTLTQDSPKLFPMYTPGFAGPELYRKGQPLGPWTDIYGLGATMFASMAGAPPQPADQRQLHDKMPGILANLARSYSEGLLDIVHWCLMLDPLERPQSLFTLQRALRDTGAAMQAVKAGRSSGIGRWIDTLIRRSSSREASNWQDQRTKV